MAERQTERIENPAKVFLRRYKGLVRRQESIIRSINAAYERATSCTTRLRPVYTTGGFTSDRMAEDIARIADEKEQLLAQKAQIDAALAEILDAINSLDDEMQKAVLTMRYVEGLDWLSVADNIGYETTMIYEYHGRALLGVNRYMIAHGISANSNDNRSNSAE